MADSALEGFMLESAENAELVSRLKTDASEVLDRLLYSVIKHYRRPQMTLTKDHLADELIMQCGSPSAAAAFVVDYDKEIRERNEALRDIQDLCRRASEQHFYDNASEQDLIDIGCVPRTVERK